MQGVLINLEEMVKELVFPTLLKNGAKIAIFYQISHKGHEAQNFKAISKVGNTAKN